METQETISTDKSAQDNTVLLQYLVEQFGEKVKELADQVDNSFTKVRFKGEKDDLALFVEKMHHHPLDSTNHGIQSGIMYLQVLVHKKLMKELFESNKKRLNYLYGVKKDYTYILSLKNNSFEERDFFRNKLFDLHESKPYSQFLNVNLEFMPDEIKENDFIKNEVVKLELSA